MSEKIRIAYAEDHTAFREALISTLLSFNEFEIQIEAGNGRELIDKIKASHLTPDVCLIDINMPVLNGFDTIQELRMHWPTIKVLVLTAYRFDQYINRMLEYRANGYILKDAHIAEIRTAILSIHSKGYYHTELIEQSKYKRAAYGKSHLISSLSERELQVIRLACSDLNYAEIAEIIGTTKKSVEGYRDSIFRKLNISSRSNLVIIAIQYGIVSLDINENGDNTFLLTNK